MLKIGHSRRGWTWGASTARALSTSCDRSPRRMTTTTGDKRSPESTASRSWPGSSRSPTGMWEATMSTLNADGTRVGDAFLTTVNVDFYGAWEPRPGRSHHPPAMSPRRMDLWRPPGRPCEPGRATGLWRLPADCRELCPPGDHRRARSPMRLGRRAWGAVCSRDTRAALSATHRRRAARPARGKWRRRGRHGQPGRRHPITRSRYGAAHHSEGSGWGMS